MIYYAQEVRNGKKKMKTIYFDMDGTIANLYGVDNWLPRLRSEDATPYEEACPMWDTKNIKEVRKSPKIISRILR